MNFSSWNNSLSSQHGDTHHDTSTTRVKKGKPNAARSKTNEIQNHSSSNEDAATETGKPFWLQPLYFYLLSLLGLGWILRLLIYYRSVSVNIFMRKVVLR